jgi:hypothetical protein
MGNNNIDFLASNFSLKKYKQLQTVNNGVNSKEVDTIKNKISTAASWLKPSSSSSTLVLSNASGTESTTISTTNPALAKEDKLDQILNLLEDITGKDVTEQEFAGFIKDFETNLKSAKPLTGKDIREADSILSQEDINTSNLGVSAGDENAFANFKLDFYKAQKEGLENSLGEWKGVNSAKARREIRNINNQIKIVGKATNFWQGRADSWEEKMKNGESKVGDDKFSTFKSNFYKSQLTGLENTMDEWLSVDKQTLHSRKQIAEIDKQIKLTEEADKFWTKENDFWRNENKAQYKTGDQAKVKKIYIGIEKIENNYDAALMGDAWAGAPEVLMKELNTLKGSLDKLKVKQEVKNDKQLKLDFKENASFADFKVGFYDSQKPELKKLMDEFIKVGDKKELANIREVMNLSEVAKSFWKDQNEFWTDLDKRKFSTENERELKTLTSRVIELESLIDEASAGSNRTGEYHAKKADLVSELNSVKSDIYALQA